MIEVDILFPMVLLYDEFRPILEEREKKTGKWLLRYTWSEYI